MGTRILWQDIMHGEDLGPEDSTTILESLTRFSERVARPDTAVTVRHLGKAGVGGPAMTFPSLRPLWEAAVISGALAAEQEGFDAVMIGCAFDPGLHHARGLLRIPVTSVTESALTLAQLLGRKIGIVAGTAPLVAPTEDNVHFLGFRDRVVTPIRHFEAGAGSMILDAFKGSPDKLIECFEEPAREAIRDGADVIVVGSGWTGPALTLCGYTKVSGTDVPIVDGSLAALKLAESLADLRALGIEKSTSSATSLYRTPPAEVVESAAADLAKVLS